MGEEKGTALVEVQTTEIQEAGKPAVLTDEAITIIKHNIDMAQKLIYEVLEEGVDYGRIPGTPAPSLWDPGANKIASAFNVYPKYNLLRSEESDSLISYTVESTLLGRSTGMPMGTGIGAASTRETKYKYRWFTAGEAREIGYSLEQLKEFKKKDDKYRIPNPEYGELVNTIVKMASKRSDVDAVQNLPGVSSALRKLFQQPGDERNKWRFFWGKVTQLGLTQEQVHKVLGVTSVNDWLSQGKTLEQAIETLARRPMEPEAEPKVEVLDIPFIEDKLMQGWKIAKDGVKRLKITEEQVSKWFDHYNVKLGLADFEKAVPPAGITNEMLSRFVDSLVKYESNCRRLQAGSAKNGPGKKE